MPDAPTDLAPAHDPTTEPAVRDDIVITDFDDQPGTKFAVLRRLWVLSSAVMALGVTIAVFNRPILALMRRGESFNGILKSHSLGDHIAYMSIISNVEHHGAAYAEPHTNTGSSIYPSGYYWFSGMLARLPRIEAIGAFNISAALSLIALVTLIALWIRGTTRSAFYWVLAPLPIFMGTLLWLSRNPTPPFWYRMYGDHAMVWPPAAILYGNGSEAPGLVFGFASILVLHLAIAAQDSRKQLKLAVAAGLLLGITFNVHSYTSIFAMTWAVAFIVAERAVALSTRQRLIGLGIGAVAVVAAGFTPVNTPLTKLALVAAAGALPILVVPAYRRARLKLSLVFGASFAVAASPLLVRIVAQALDKSSYLYLRSEDASVKDLSVPVRPFVWMNAPVLLLVGATLTWLVLRRNKTPFEQRWLALVASGAVVWVALTFNRAWGLNQEPYRFLPYGIICLTAICLPWLLRIPRKTIFSLGLRGGVLIALLLTLPTTRVLFRSLNYSVQISPQERRAYREIGEFIGSTDLSFPDSCVIGRVARVVSGTPTSTFLFGLAIPDRHEQITAINNRIGARVIPSTAELQAAGVQWIITTNYCQGDTPKVFRQRYGEPAKTVPLQNAQECGLPEDFAFEIFTVTKNNDEPYPLPNDGFAVTETFRNFELAGQSRFCWSALGGASGG